jgi:hypothetical protein
MFKVLFLCSVLFFGMTEGDALREMRSYYDSSVIDWAYCVSAINVNLYSCLGSCRGDYGVYRYCVGDCRSRYMLDIGECVEYLENMIRTVMKGGSLIKKNKK